MLSSVVNLQRAINRGGDKIAYPVGSFIKGVRSVVAAARKRRHQQDLLTAGELAILTRAGAKI